jgi:hypothetical protein
MAGSAVEQGDGDPLHPNGSYRHAHATSAYLDRSRQLSPDGLHAYGGHGRPWSNRQRDWIRRQIDAAVRQTIDLTDLGRRKPGGRRG